jgi:hypothetical protein
MTGRGKKKGGVRGSYKKRILSLKKKTKRARTSGYLFSQGSRDVRAKSTHSFTSLFS